MISEISFIKNYPSFWDEFTPNSRDLVIEINSQSDNFGHFSHISFDEAKFRSINNMIAYKRFELLYQEQNVDIDLIFQELKPVIELLPRTNIENYEINNPINIKAIDQISLNLYFFYQEKRITFNPLFKGCSFLSECKGDLLYEFTLTELKAGDRKFTIEDIRQILVYILLNFLSKQYIFENIELLNPRTGQYIKMALNDFIAKTSILSIEDLSIEFSNYLYTLSTIRE